MKLNAIILFFKAQHVKIVVFFIFLYAIYLRLSRLAGREWWGDEVYQFDQMKGPLKSFWLHHTYGDFSSFPGNYLINYPFIAMFGMNKWALAIPAIASMVLMFYLLYKLSHRFYATLIGYVVTFLMVAFNEDLIFHGLEFRPYSILPTLALASVYFYDLLINQYPRLLRWQKVSIVVFFLFTAIFHAYGILIIFLPLVFSITLNFKIIKQGAISKGLLQYTGIVLLFSTLLWAWYASSSHFGFKANNQPLMDNVFQFLPSPFLDLVDFLRIVLAILAGYKPFHFFMFGVLALFLPNASRLRQLSLLLLLVIIPVALILYTDIRSQYWFLQRQFIWVMPFFIIFLGWGWDTFFVLIIRIKNLLFKFKP